MSECLSTELHYRTTRSNVLEVLGDVSASYVFQAVGMNIIMNSSVRRKRLKQDLTGFWTSSQVNVCWVLVLVLVLVSLVVSVSVSVC